MGEVPPEPAALVVPPEVWIVTVLAGLLATGVVVVLWTVPGVARLFNFVDFVRWVGVSAWRMALRAGIWRGDRDRAAVDVLEEGAARGIVMKEALARTLVATGLGLLTRRDQSRRR